MKDDSVKARLCCVCRDGGSRNIISGMHGVNY